MGLRLRRCLVVVELRHNLPPQTLLQVHRVHGLGLQRLAHLGQILIGHVSNQIEVVHHQGVREGHNLAVHIVGRFVHADVVVKALAHLLLSVRPYQDRHGEALLLSLPHHSLEVAAHQQVELLVGAAEFHVGLDGHRVVGLEQRVKQLRDGNGTLCPEALGEVVPGQELGHGKAAGQVEDVGKGKLPEPLALPDDLCPLLVHHFEEVTHIGLGIVPHLLSSQHRPGNGLAAGVAYLSCPIPDYEDHLVSQVLKLAQLSKPHRVAQMNVRAAGIEAHLQAQRSALLKAAHKLLLYDDLGHAAPDHALEGLGVYCAVSQVGLPASHKGKV